MDGKQLDALIDHFEILTKTGQNISNPQPDWKAVWAKAAEVQEAFREVRYPTKQERDDAWERFAAIREEVSRRAQQEGDERWSQSTYHRDTILSQIESARPYSLFGFDPPDVAEMKSLGEALREGGRMLSDNKGNVWRAQTRMFRPYR